MPKKASANSPNPFDAILAQRDPASQAAVARELAQAVKEDRDCRYPGVTAGLYELSSLAPFARLGHGLPVIRKANRTWQNVERETVNGKVAEQVPVDNVPEFQRADSLEEFTRRFKKDASILATFNLKAHGLCLAGGSVGALLMFDDEHRPRKYSDFDLFLVGHRTDEEAAAAIEALRHHLVACAAVAEDSHADDSHSDSEEEFGVTAYRTLGCITFCVRVGKKKTIIQVILRRYNTPGEIIHSFDPWGDGLRPIPPCNPPFVYRPWVSWSDLVGLGGDTHPHYCRRNGGF